MYIVNYPYLQEIYHNYDHEQERQERQRFLDDIDRFLNQRRYVRITLLDWDENPLREIQGELTSGSLVKDGTSSVRRSCNFSAVVGGGTYDVQDLEMSFSLNKKIYLETGIKNDSDKYPEYPILWFPQGLFFITSISLSSSTSTGVNINIQCRDKMCLLNGEIGGLFPATTILDTVDHQDPDGIYVQKKVPIYDLIKELVNHFGGEPLQNIVVENVSPKIRRILQWKGENPLYIYGNKNDNELYASVDPIDGESSYTVFNVGQDIGYAMDDFYYTNELVANAGQTICSVLDTLKNYLGNYEYFYDIYGVFHFQEIKNYLNTTQGKILVDDMSKNDYLVDTTLSKDLYSFDSNRNLVSINASPQYQNIKNDFTVVGTRKAAGTNTAYPVRYHLVIDRKPTGNTYTRPEGNKYISYIYPEDMSSNQIMSQVSYLKDEFTKLKEDASMSVSEKISKLRDLQSIIGGYSGALESSTFLNPKNKKRTQKMYKALVEDIDQLISDLTDTQSQDEAEKVITDSINDFFTDSYIRRVVRETSLSNVYYPRKNLLVYKESGSGLAKGTFLELIEGDSWSAIDVPDGVNFNLVYALCSKDDSGKVTIHTDLGFRYWDNEFKDVTPLAFFPKYYPVDWRTELYIRGLEARSNATDAGYYFTELESGWPSIYDIIEQKFLAADMIPGETISDDDEYVNYMYSNTPTGDYFLDFIDPTMTSLGKFAVEAIGRRPFVHKDDSVNCLFEPIVPDIEYIDTGELDDIIEEKRADVINRGVPFVQVQAGLYDNMYTGGYHNAAFDTISFDMTQHTTYQSTVSMTVIPADYMEPNTRAVVSDKTTNTYGSYVVTNISMPLAPGGNMSVTAHEAIERY